jgi:ubiquitin carboxyl-terminal hydrolase 4/11/15
VAHVAHANEQNVADEYEKELNPSNPLAHNGKVAKAYAGLLKNIFASQSPSSVAPRDFKNIIGRFGPSFSGYQQQDSQEFLAFLLDGMHEDLNRIMKKPYTEKPDSTDEMVGNPELIAKLADTHWNIYKSRNDSAVADLFGGLYQSTLVCPKCQKVSITFDPFMDLTLPLPIESFWNMEVRFFPRKTNPYRTPVRVPVEMPKNSSIAALKEYLGKKLNVDPKKVCLSKAVAWHGC